MTTREIKLKIHEEEDLYTPLDPEQRMLSEDVISYFFRNFIRKHRALHEQYVIHIVTDTPVNEEKARECIKAHFIQGKDDLAFGVKKLTIKEICLAVLGVILLSIWLYLYSTRPDNVRLEILSIMGWVVIWEATGIAVMQRPEIRLQQKNYQRLADAQIVFELTEQ